jgi:hypothetical protein
LFVQDGGFGIPIIIAQNQATFNFSAAASNGLHFATLSFLE